MNRYVDYNFYHYRGHQSLVIPTYWCINNINSKLNLFYRKTYVFFKEAGTIEKLD